MPDASPPPENESSFELLVRARSGNPDALERLCAHYLPRLHRWATGRLPEGSRGALETGDLVQDVLLKAVRHIEVFEPRHEWSFQAYLRRALLNRLRDEARRLKRQSPRDPLDSAQPSLDASPLERAVGAETLERYEAALARLRPEDQQAILARCEWGMTHAEVADALGKSSAGAAQVAVHRALVRLAREMTHGR